MVSNKLYFGDCLEVMRADVPSESVDLIYLDPPFNSKRLYNAFIGGAQWVAFKDTWRWHEAVNDFHDLASQPRLAKMIEGLRTMLGEGAQLAYLSYMGNRIVECHRVLKPTGSIYIHCDPTMSHYLKVVMDGVFGRENFLNELVWYYRGAGIPKRAFARRHDVLLVYTKEEGENNFNADPVRQPYADATVERFKHYIGNVREGHDYGQQELNPKEKHPDDVITHIQPIAPSAKERLGFPTQKPITLLEHILKASSKEGDMVLDPFCGCGTTVHAAQNLERRWIGIDICVNACKEIEQRLTSHFDSVWDEVEFIGMPKTVEDAKFMAKDDPFRFERWAAALVDGIEPNVRQRGDKGIDGWGRLPIRKGKFVDIVSQVKGGRTNPGHVQAFNGARQQAGADIGIFTCFEDRVTTGMRDAAASAGLFMGTQVIQIYTVEDYFAGRRPMMPVVGR